VVVGRNEDHKKQPLGALEQLSGKADTLRKRVTVPKGLKKVSDGEKQ